MIYQRSLFPQRNLLRYQRTSLKFNAQVPDSVYQRPSQTSLIGLDGIFPPGIWYSASTTSAGLRRLFLPDQILMQPHCTSPPALRLPDQQRRRIPRVVEIAPFQLEDLGDPQASAPHDERRRAGLVPVMGRQRVQQALNLPGRPVMRYIHAGRIPIRTLPKAVNVINFAPRGPHPRAPEVADFEPKSAIV